MDIRFACECGRKFKARDRYVGTSVNCPDCGRVVTVPPLPGGATPLWQDDEPAVVRVAPSPSAPVPPAKSSGAALLMAGLFGVVLGAALATAIWTIRLREPPPVHESVLSTNPIATTNAVEPKP
jgi:hypothetical protein